MIKYLRIVMLLPLCPLLLGCAPAYSVYQFDNGDDYYEEGLRRIVDKNARIGYEDEAGNVVISPRFAFGFPFKNGVAKVTDEGAAISDGEHKKWQSGNWYLIDRQGRMFKEGLIN